MEGARCLGEVVLLSSTLDAWSANPCAILALSLWLVGFHCNCFAACRALTFVFLQLSQQNLTLLRFLLISLLAYAAPLFGKRGAPKPKAKSESKQQKVVNSAIAVQSATLPSKRYRTALRNLRQSGPQDTVLGEPRADPAVEFPGIPVVFLALLLSVYPVEVLREALSHERVRLLAIWGDFAQEYEGISSPQAEQQLLDTYRRRFANVLLSLENCALQSDTERLAALRRDKKMLEKVRGDGNCLIWALLAGHNMSKPVL